MHGDAIGRMLRRARPGFCGLLAISFAVNALLLAQPLYMLQVYDRVLSSGSIETLVLISLLAFAAFALLGFLDAVRSFTAMRIAAGLAVEGGDAALRASLRGEAAGFGDIQPLRDLATIRGFVGNKGVFNLFDLPYAPFFIGLLYIIHPGLFWLTLGGGLVLLGLALANNALTSRAAASEGPAGPALTGLAMAQAFVRSAETVQVLGMVGHVTGAWGREEARSLRSGERTARIGATLGGASRSLRMVLQIAILGYGSYLVLAGEMTAGMIFASSLLSARGLQPIDQIIAGWKSLSEALAAWRRLRPALTQAETGLRFTQLPQPKGRLDVEDLLVFAAHAKPGADPLLKRISFHASPGECLAIVGPSGAGKSLLARTIVGAVRPRSGAVRLDGANIRHWDPETLGRHLGYLAEQVELLPGTVRENIGRFDPEAGDEAVVEAARRAHAHTLILGLPEGYDTILGPTGHRLSAGQRQRIAFARALFGRPSLIVLDEPNANLDADGEAALEAAVQGAKKTGATILIVTHRRRIIDAADKILVLERGTVEDYGPRADVLRRQLGKRADAQSRATGSAPDPLRPPAPERPSLVSRSA